MSDARRSRRANSRSRRTDSHQMWDDSDHRDRLSRGHEGDRDRDRNRGTERKEHRSRSRDRQRRQGRSRSPDWRPRERDQAGGRGGRDRGPAADRGRGRDGARRHEERDRRDRRRDDVDDRSRRNKPRDAGPRRSQSPRSPHSPPTSLPTRGRPDKKQPQTNMSFNVNRRSESPARERRRPSPDDGDAPMEDNVGSDEDGEIAVDAGDDDMAAMQAMMGFGGFGTTKGQKVAGNNAGGVHKEKKVEYRQYMNRQGGFNRPLSPSR